MTEWPAELEPVTKIIIWDSKLNDFIEKYLGREWSFQQSGFHGQNTMHELECYKNPEATAKVEAWLASPPAAMPGRAPEGSDPVRSMDDTYRPGTTNNETVEIYTEDLIAELCNRGLLPEGDMTVEVWW